MGLHVTLKYCLIWDSTVPFLTHLGGPLLTKEYSTFISYPILQPHLLSHHRPPSVAHQACSFSPCHRQCFCLRNVALSPLSAIISPDFHSESSHLSSNVQLITHSWKGASLSLNWIARFRHAFITYAHHVHCREMSNAETQNQGGRRNKRLIISPHFTIHIQSYAFLYSFLLVLTSSPLLVVQGRKVEKTIIIIL